MTLKEAIQKDGQRNLYVKSSITILLGQSNITQKWSCFHNFSRMLLINELFLTFWASIKYAKAQFNSITFSRVVGSRTTTTITCTNKF